VDFGLEPRDAVTRAGDVDEARSLHPAGPAIVNA